ncbi:GTPase HflX like protein, partial [Aduncisulcus paluster]
MLFATLDTYTRRIEFDDNKPFVLVDTVGFVSKLPHALVQAFKATLEEVVEADLIVHVVDASAEHYKLQISVTNNVLSELGAGDKAQIVAYNKIDLVEDRT